ncbi:MAG: tRNA (adenosine(37)-N6)-threonylcarbamoyltransferase complex transferase subunit TsaD [Candidatus Ryanbacteria bacterium RIFCSPHIGHO2_02_FULL_48_12]|nr:MAG: tRNA (adenosine(37)-N6)-threonylcarbamoyltransferase complex transferase subunit TsaD [Candidatus Ryanbacteria bacterium RIFCSPHIGHO2_02_FULL_48_12]
MRILAIETSCDETAIAIVECSGNETSARFTVLGNALLSQVEIHKEYGGVVPMLAKREHQKNLPHILDKAIAEANVPLQDIDAIAVTAGPGLEPALWVGINFAKALALVWNKPLVAVNHMEGHLLASLSEKIGEQLSISNLQFPILALLISGGHTELVLMKKWLEYELVGQTRDDAVGEAFDKVARMLGLPYPGGLEISRLAEEVRSLGFVNPSSDEGFTKPFILPRPMIDSGTCDFSFAGLKTAVLYLLKKIPDISEKEKQHIAHEFENAVADVLWKKTALALEQTSAQTLVIGGGVSANTHIRRVFKNSVDIRYPQVTLRIPTASLTTDNAVMIAIAGYYHASRKEFVTDIVANGNLSLAQH